MTENDRLREVLRLTKKATIDLRTALTLLMDVMGEEEEIRIHEMSLDEIVPAINLHTDLQIKAAVVAQRQDLLDMKG